MPRAFLIRKEQASNGPVPSLEEDLPKKQTKMSDFSIDHILNSSGNSTEEEDVEMQDSADSVTTTRNDDRCGKSTPEIRSLLNQPTQAVYGPSGARRPVSGGRSREFTPYQTLLPFVNMPQSYLALNYQLQQHLRSQAMHEAHKLGYQYPAAQPFNAMFPPIMSVAPGLMPPNPVKQTDYLYNKMRLDEPSFRDASPPLVSPPIGEDKLSFPLAPSDMSNKKHHPELSAPNRQYTCDACCKSYSTFSGLSKHKQFHCQQVVKKQFSCKYCDKVYGSLGALKMHIRTHTLPCKCGVCGKAFSRPWLLQGHIRTHTGEKPFSCQHCNRAFADRSNLRAHLQTHSDVKKYSCKNCTKTFSRMSLLLKHEDGGCTGQLPQMYGQTSPTYQ